jgi:hypothetical protein
MEWAKLRTRSQRLTAPSCFFFAVACALFVTLAAALPGLLSSAHTPGSNTELTAHEWGTFTTIAGTDGLAVEWLPLSGSPDLPGFVEHYRTSVFKLGLRGTVRMETPVIYFYCPQKITISVHVSFAKGLITEWYPHADKVEPIASATDSSLYQQHADGSISWDSVILSPNAATSFPREASDTHYYTARETSAVPLSAKTAIGSQQEKFLFYRGVSTIGLPVSAKVLPDGKVEFNNLGTETIPSVILFERRGDRLGYKISGSVAERAILDPPTVSGTLDSLSSDLENTLVEQGLFPDEACAMVKTWRESWFEEGSRLFYIVPRRILDSILPLSITPAPGQLERVFIGRIDLVTPATQQTIERAYASGNTEVLTKYGRFLEPILQTMIQKETNADRAERLREYLNSFYSAVLASRH